MLRCPLQNECKLSTIKMIFEHSERAYLNLGFCIGVAGVEVRDAVILEVHPDRDAEEAADCGHPHNVI